MKIPDKFFVTNKNKEKTKDIDQEIINMAYDKIDPIYGSYYASERTNEMYNIDFMKKINYLKSLN